MKKKTTPKGPSDWELQQRKEKKRERLVRAVAEVILDHGVLWRFRRDDELVHALEQLAEQLPALRLLEALEQIDAKEAQEHAKFEAQFKKARKPRATTAQQKRQREALKSKPRKSKPAKTAATAKPAKKWDPTPATELEAKLPGYLEDEALNLASKKGAVTAGDLLKALPEATRGQATGALARLVTRGRLSMTGRARGAKYVLPNGAGTQVALDEAAAT